MESQSKNVHYDVSVTRDAIFSSTLLLRQHQLVENQVLHTIHATLNVAVSRGCDTYFREKLVMCQIYWFWLKKLTHIASLQFLPLDQYVLCFAYCFSGPLPLRFHKGGVTFLGPVSGSPQSIDYTEKLDRSTLALELSVAHLFTYG